MTDRQQQGPRVCPKCGKPLQVRLTDVWPAGMPVSPMFHGVFSTHGGMLGCACDCDEQALIRAVSHHVYRHADTPEVAIRFTAVDLRAKFQAERLAGASEEEALRAVEEARLDGTQRARPVVERWARLAAPGFTAWVNEEQPGACYASKAVYDGIRKGELELSIVPRITPMKPRERWAQLRDVADMARG